MGTHSSDFRLITRKPYRTPDPVPAPVDTRQCADAERDMSDAGGGGFILFLLGLVLSAVAWWLV